MYGDVKVKNRVPSKQLKEKLGIDDRHNLGTTEKQVAMVWASAAKKRQ